MTEQYGLGWTASARNAFHAYVAPPAWVEDLMREAEQAGVYTTGIASRSTGRGESINTAVYGWDDAQSLAVIQVRWCRFRPNRFNKVRKDYYLLGHVEDGTVFAHPVVSPLRSKVAMDSPEACVAWVLASVWDCKMDDLPEIRRQGDVALIPATLPATAHPLVVQTMTIRGTHVITADQIWTDGDTFYVRRKATAVHTKGEHATLKVRHGAYRVQAGIRAQVWGFTAPTGD
jgi:hypothetical protein